MGEKQAYWDRVDETMRNPFKFMSINTDGMDQFKTALPVHVGDDVQRVTQHLQGNVSKTVIINTHIYLFTTTLLNNIYRCYRAWPGSSYLSNLRKCSQGLLSRNPLHVASN
jgi:hypothetical protein